MRNFPQLSWMPQWEDWIILMRLIWSAFVTVFVTQSSLVMLSSSHPIFYPSLLILCVCLLCEFSFCYEFTTERKRNNHELILISSFCVWLNLSIPWQKNSSLPTSWILMMDIPGKPRSTCDSAPLGLRCTCIYIPKWHLLDGRYKSFHGHVLLRCISSISESLSFWELSLFIGSDASHLINTNPTEAMLITDSSMPLL